MQPNPMTSVMQFTMTFCSLCVAAAAITFAVVTMRAERNASLVSIGVSILRADPQKESQVTGAREWALDLIEANAGGVKFSAEARKELMNNQLGWFDTGSSYYPSSSSTFYPSVGNTYYPGGKQQPIAPPDQPK